jgi:hypothetical protein
MNKQMVRVAMGCALAVAFTLPLGRAAFGDVRSDCARKLEVDRARIDREAAKHGEHSPEVGKAVDRMEEDRAWCRDHKAEWDHDRFDVGIYVRH